MRGLVLGSLATFAAALCFSFAGTVVFATAAEAKSKRSAEGCLVRCLERYRNSKAAYQRCTWICLSR